MSSAEYWLRNEVESVYATIPLEEDCETIDMQLCRDMYYQSDVFEFKGLGNCALSLYEYGDVVLGEDNIHTQYVHEQGIIEGRPVGWTKLGLLVKCDNIRNTIGEPEHILIAGSMFCSDNQKIFDVLMGEFPKSVWDVINTEVSGLTVNGLDNVICKYGLAIGGHLVYREVYEEEELRYAISEGVQFNDRSADIVETEDGLRLYVPDHMFIRPGVVIGADVTSDQGSVYSFGIKSTATS